MNDKLLTIKQYSEQAGITQQAVYKQLNKRLKNYVVVVENQKMLKESALKDFHVQPSRTTVKQPENDHFDTLLKQNQQTIDLLQKELERKNDQISELQKIIDQEQKLRLAEHKRIIELEAKTAAPEPEPEPVEQEPEPPKRKKGFRFWKRGV